MIDVTGVNGSALVERANTDVNCLALDAPAEHRLTDFKSLGDVSERNGWHSNRSLTSCTLFI
jgi:hypothetical protein